ncbi:MAG: hypothetical protein GPJ54_04475 [Candidatus Heimdallarchaeota archaeon]|nr:hypothetical protein [Candidatus Heimdallarchaeota archaeon]
MAFLNRSENKLKPKLAASTVIDCLVCKQQTTYRKLVPEDLNAINTKEFNQTVKAMYNEIMKMKDSKGEIRND